MSRLPLTPKSRPPLPVLPRPRRPGMVALFLVVPTVAGGMLGALVGLVVQRMMLGVLLGGVVGFLVGVETVVRLLSYAAERIAHATHRE